MKKLLTSMYRGVTLSTFKSIFKTMLLLVLIPVCAAVLIGLNSLNIVQREIKNSADVVFEEIQDEIDQNFKIALNLTNRIRKAPLIIDYAKSGTRNYYQEHEILTELQELVSGFEQVELVYVYYPQFNRIISNNSGADMKQFHAQNYSGNYEEWAKGLCIRQNISVSAMKRLEHGNSCNIISKVLNIRTDAPQAVVVVQLKETSFAEILNRLRLKSSDQILVFFKDYCIGSTLGDGADQEYLNKIRESTLERQEYTLNRTKYKIQTLNSPQYGLSFIYLTPNSVFHNSIQFARMYAALALFFCVCITGVLCFLFSKRMDFSFHQVKNQNDQLILTVKQYSDELKEAYLEKVMLGHVASAPGIKEGCRLYGIDVEEHWFGLMLISFENDEKGSLDRIAATSLKSIKDLVKNHILKNSTTFDSVAVMITEDQYYCMISGRTDNAFSYQKELQSCGEYIKDSLLKEEKLSCMVYLSYAFKDIENMNEAYQTVTKLQKMSEEEAEVRESEKCSVEKILTVIKKRITDSNFSVADIALTLDVSTSYLSRYFKKQTGLGILEYIHQYRITMSKEIMMKNKDIKIKKIAEMTGFYSDVVFIRVFKKNEGITPGQYKEYLAGQKRNMEGQN